MTRPAIVGPSTSMRRVQRLIESLVHHGVVVPAHYRAHLARPSEGRVPMTMVAELWRWALQETGDPLLGMRLAHHEPFGRWGEVELLMMTSSRAVDMHEVARRYWELVADGQVFEHHQEGEHRARLVLGSHYPGNVVATQLYESALVYIARFVRLVFGPHMRPQQVCLTRAPVREDLTPFFDAPVVFEAPAHSLVYPSSSMSSASSMHQRDVHEALRQRSEQQRLARLRSSSFATRAEQVIRRAGHVDLPRVARALGVSTRVLQRRLAAEGTSWRELRESTRRSLAEQLIRSSSLSFSEIAAKLGYAEPSAFFRAFKRWTGTTARESRQRNRPES